jgi:hypothetical protein
LAAEVDKRLSNRKRKREDNNNDQNEKRKRENEKPDTSDQNENRKREEEGGGDNLDSSDQDSKHRKVVEGAKWTNEDAIKLLRDKWSEWTRDISDFLLDEEAAVEMLKETQDRNHPPDKKEVMRLVKDKWKEWTRKDAGGGPHDHVFENRSNVSIGFILGGESSTLQF